MRKRSQFYNDKRSWTFISCQQQWGSTSYSGLPFIKTSGDKKLIFRQSGSWLFQQAQVVINQDLAKEQQRKTPHLTLYSLCSSCFPLAAESTVNCFSRIQMKMLWNSHQIAFLCFLYFFRVMLFSLNFKAQRGWKSLGRFGHSTAFLEPTSLVWFVWEAAELICCAGGRFCCLLGWLCWFECVLWM